MKLRNTIDKDVLMAAGYSGKFKAKKFYLSLISTEKVTYHKTVWHKLKVSKHRFILWQAINEKLLTRDQLARFITLDSSICPVYEIVPESHLHLFFSCVYSRRVLAEISTWFGGIAWPISLSDWLQESARKESVMAVVASAIIAVVVYLIWCNRNRCVFDGACCSLLGSVSLFCGG
ncbi:hypothetical protein CsatB_019072 [Cannabis sativa]